MAKNEKGAKYLTSLDFDIEGLKRTLEEVGTLTETKAREIGENFAKNMQENFTNLKGQNPIGIDDNKIKQSVQSANELGKGFSLVSEEIKKVNGRIVQLSQTTENSAGITKKVTKNIKAQSTEIFEHEKLNLKKSQKFTEERIAEAQRYYNNLAGINTERSRSQEELFNIAYRLTEKEKQQNKSLIEQIDKLIAKQKALSQVAIQRKSTLVNKGDIEESKKVESALESIKKQIIETGKATPETKTRIEELKIAQSDLGKSIKKTATVHEGFLKTIADKARWLSAFYALDALKKGLQESIVVIKETEDAAVELQRVLSEKIGQEEITSSLFEIATKYGRTFQDVQEVAVKFAQTGASWNDSLKLTESTMLALNTAELDVKQSTEGLIAIMSQWNIQAKDMQDVIDKINITADKFPVTSEKIVAALQRASSSAKNANLSLEETIGVITALSKATGRSGENIGTAINSLLIYTSKSKALETFYEVGDETVKKTVDAYRAGAASILDVWRALSENLKNLKTEQEQMQLLGGVDTEELGMHLEQEAAGITEDIKKIYGSAGTFRQNYLVALLNDIDTIESVTQNMTNAIGYSTAENEKYMQTLGAYYNQFKESIKETVVQAGQGALGLNVALKALLSLGTALVKLQKSMGGIYTLLGAILGVTIKIKAVKLKEKVTDPLISSFNELRSKLKLANEQIKQGKTLTDKYRIALRLLHIEAKNGVETFGLWQIAISAGLAIINGIVAAYNKARQVADEYRKGVIESAQSQVESSKSTIALYNEMKYLLDVGERTESQQKRLTEIGQKLGISLDDIKSSTQQAKEEMSEFDKALGSVGQTAKGLSNAEWEKYIKGLEDELDKAAGKAEFLKGFLDFFKGFAKGGESEISDSAMSDVTAILDKRLKKYQKVVTTPTRNELVYDFSLEEDVVEQYNDLIVAKKELDLLSEQEGREGVGLTEQYKQITVQLEKEKEAYEALIKARAERILQGKDENTIIPKTAEEYAKFRDTLWEAVGATEESKKNLGELADEYFPHFASVVKETADALSISDETLEQFSEKIKSLNQDIDSSQSALNSVYDAVAQYNEQGYLTVDMIQTLVGAGSEYLELLEFTEQGLALNEQATEYLINAQRANVLEMIKQSAASEILKAAQEALEGTNENAKISSIDFSEGLTQVEEELRRTTAEAIAGAEAVSDFGVSLAKALGKSAPESFDEQGFAEKTQKIYDSYKKLYDGIANGIGKVEQFSSSATNAQKKHYDEQKKAAKDRYDAEKKEIESLKKAINDRFKAVKDKLEKEKEAVKDRYNAQIEALKKVQKENDRLDKQEDYIRNKRKAEDELEEASARSGVEWQQKKAEAQEKISDIEKDWQKQQRDWEIEDRIKALEAARDAELKIIEERIKAAEVLKEKELKAAEEKLKLLETQKEAEFKALEDKANVANSYNKRMAKDYHDNYAVPVMEDTKKAYDEAYKHVENRTNAFFDTMLRSAKKNANNMLQIYENDFIKKFSGSISMANKQPIYGPMPMSPSNFPQFYPPSVQGPSQSYYSTTNNRNAIVSANISGREAGKSFGKKIFDLP